jgi:hypothetical protein
MSGSATSGTAHFKNRKPLFEYRIYSFLETSGGQSYFLYLNVHFFNTGVN